MLISVKFNKRDRKDGNLSNPLLGDKMDDKESIEENVFFKNFN